MPVIPPGDAVFLRTRIHPFTGCGVRADRNRLVEPLAAGARAHATQIDDIDRDAGLAQSEDGSGRAGQDHDRFRCRSEFHEANGSLGYRSCLMVHSDSDIFSPEDIAGKTFAFNDPNSTSGYLVPSAFFLMEMGIDPKTYFSKLTFSGSHEASIIAVANKKVDVASTNLPDLQQLVREGKVPRAALRVIWVSKLIPLDPVVIRKDLPASLRTAIQDSLATMKTRSPQAFVEGGAFLGGFAKADDSKYQIIRDLNDAAKKLAAQK